MEYEHKNQNSARGKGRGRGRGRKKAVENETKTPDPVTNNEEPPCVEQESVTLDMDADITQLEAPTFSTINKGPPEPMLRLQWDHKTHLIGEKVINPMIHCCDKCSFPIIIYGRMIPCKHVFCFSCGERDNKVCPRCQEKVVRVEKTGLGTVFMCTFGGTRYGSTGCRRTYLSQRDLQAHINHRHVSGTLPNKENANNQSIPATKQPLPTSTRLKPVPSSHHAAVGDPRVQTNPSNDYYKKHSSHSSSQPMHQPSLRQQQQSQHHAHHQDTHSQHGLQHQHHLPVTAATQLLQSADFASQLMASSYGSAGVGGGVGGVGGGGGGGGGGTGSPSMRSNLITVQIHDSNAGAVGLDASGIGTGLPMPPNFTLQSFAPQFSPQNTSNPMTPFPVPPPSLGPIPQSLSQFFSANSPGYVTPPPQQQQQQQQRNVNTPFNSNLQTSPMIAQQMMNPVAMAQQSRRPQFPPSVEQVMQPFPVPPPPHWHPTPNQTHFF